MKAHIPHTSRRGGQTLIVIALAVGILFFAVLWVADVHHFVFTKNKSQNAGDAAALAAARWQASTLNFQGELNLMHAMALAAGNHTAAGAITQTQARLAFTGPMTAVAAAQQGAKLNSIPVNDDFTAFVRDRARVARGSYGAASGGIPEPYPGAWDEYATMLDAIADDGVAAGIDNANFFNDPMGPHILLQIAFYNAVATRNWCFFFNHFPNLLSDYSGYRWWPALPPPDPTGFSQSELFGVWTQPGAAEFRQVLHNSGTYPGAERLGIHIPPESAIDTNELERVAYWQFYNFGRWRDWSALKNQSILLDGTLRDEYDYSGADAVARIEAVIDRLTGSGGARRRRNRAPPPPDTIIMTGAAKPFGFVENDAGQRLPPHTPHLVLPAYREVRLIPIFTSSAGVDGGSFNLAWRRHCEFHLPRYLETGRGEAGCRYCANLATWEIPSFRQEGVSWLSTNSWRCTISPPGGAPGGGTMIAH